jgi:hypothetical protein
MLPKPASIDPTPMDTIAGAKMLQERIQASGFYPDQDVIHGDRRATFIRIRRDRAAIIRHWGDSRAVAVPPNTLSLPPKKQRQPPRPSPQVG